ncbi:RNI-like protein [Anaeromyces robustus]|uniref:RNI-like protein n=1 Tax=Anaeromyces robustus TaxID=1754192 RepID=A0A1Y1X6U7_9FUNG|nr:RNI-like protein [Anaeromyces robustus]|eukprot:ORX81432.1 RNI-like protein [Anaeromyces robustus]
MKIKSLKKLYLTQISCNDSDLYEFNGLDNLEIMNVTLDSDCKFDASKLEKLSELHFEGDTSLFGQGVGSAVSLNAPNNLKKLSFTYMSISSDNYKVIGSLPNLEELTILYSSPSEKFDIKSLASHDKLKKLIITQSFYSSEPIDIDLEFLNNLNNLTYLDLSSNLIDQFPKQLASLTNLEYINLESNRIFEKIPESYNNLKNLKYL